MGETQERRYGLLMAIAMIVGIVIGSGIFFKADDILVQTHGNVAVGCLVLVIGAFGIIFGGITISEWAKITDDAGGLISYAEKSFGHSFAFILGWFQAIAYYPALTAIVAFVAANYTLSLFPQLTFAPYGIWIISVFYLVLLYGMNIFSARISGYFQTSSMFIKLIPLFLIAVLGIIFGNPPSSSGDGFSMPAVMASSGAIVSVAFSYDGWSIAPSICHEIKNAKRNLPLALIISPIIILVVYVSYFLGISYLIGPQKIMEMGDLAFSLAARSLFGSLGEKLMLLMVIISVLGTANGLALGGTRVPYALALRKDLPYSEKIAEVHPKYKVSVISSLLSLAFSGFWLFVHFLSIHIPGMKDMGIDISSIPIVIMYIFYTILYIGIIVRTKRGLIKNKLTGILCPILAILGAATILYGGLTASNAKIYLIVSFLIFVSGILFYRYVSPKSN